MNRRHAVKGMVGATVAGITSHRTAGAQSTGARADVSVNSGNSTVYGGINVQQNQANVVGTDGSVSVVQGNANGGSSVRGSSQIISSQTDAGGQGTSTDCGCSGDTPPECQPINICGVKACTEYIPAACIGYYCQQYSANGAG